MFYLTHTRNNKKTELNAVACLDLSADLSASMASTETYSFDLFPLARLECFKGDCYVNAQCELVHTLRDSMCHPEISSVSKRSQSAVRRHLYVSARNKSP